MTKSDAPAPVARSVGPVGRFARRMARGACGGAFGGVLAAGLDARWMRGAEVEPPSFALALVTEVGLLAPIAVAVGFMVAAASAWLHPKREPSWRGLLHALDRPDHDPPLAALVPLGMLAGLVATVATAHVAFRLLASGQPSMATGAAIGVATVVIAVLAIASARGAAKLVPRRWLPSARLAVSTAVALVVALVAYGIRLGSVNGEGGFLQILGVLRREELDLRAPAGLVVIVVCAYALPALLRKVSWAAAIVTALSTLALTPLASQAGSFTPVLALSIERNAPLGKMLLPRWQRWTDGDGDGISDAFGGGDCDDRDATRYPGADDVPGNGIDEDCSGSDDEVVELTKPEEAETPKSAEEWMRSKLPGNLSVVLLTIDTLRFDLGFMGYERKVSPNIDRLAARSTVFERAYALASYTGKSVGPMMTGKYPSETHRGWRHFNYFTEEDTMVQERLQRAGVRTLSVQGHWYFKANTGIGRGFDVEDHSAAPRVPQMEGDTTVNSDKLSDAAIALLKKPENVNERFFLWVHYLDPHASYVRHADFDFGRKGRDLYDGEVAFTDRHVGRLVDFIEASDFADRTAIVLTADHGEAFGEHGIMRHGRELWEEMVRVPWIVHVPGAGAHRHAARRSAIDLVPTILDLFGLPSPEGDGNDFLSGQSLLADVLMPPGHEPKERIVFIDMSAGPYNAERQAFIENDLKLTATAGRPLGLYDLATDSGETTNLMKDPERLDPVLSRFKAFRRQLREVKVKPQ